MATLKNISIPRIYSLMSITLLLDFVYVQTALVKFSIALGQRLSNVILSNVFL